MWRKTREYAQGDRNKHQVGNVFRFAMLSAYSVFCGCVGKFDLEIIFVRNISMCKALCKGLRVGFNIKGIKL